jgi:nitrite reductase (NADH) small subunit
MNMTGIATGAPISTTAPDATGEPNSSTAPWRRVCSLADIPQLGARVVRAAEGNIAVFRNDADEVFALRDHCPHKGGPLSQGIVFGRHVACPLHNWTIGLEDGRAVAPDEGCAATYPVKIEAGEVYLRIGPAC